MREIPWENKFRTNKEFSLSYKQKIPYLASDHTVYVLILRETPFIEYWKQSDRSKLLKFIHIS